jgi:hypothetical protein
MNGYLVISLDFELMWGVQDKRSINDYGKNIEGVHSLVPKLLSIFSKYDISVTFATVGFLFLKSKQDLKDNCPKLMPTYLDSRLNPYRDSYIDNVDFIERFHFAPELIDLIIDSGKHEIGSHTFSHYYCLEDGQDINQFSEDLSKFSQIATGMGINVKSIVFPRNQVNLDYLKLCSEKGITCYRGNQESWLYEPRNGQSESVLRRFLRLVDAYINISGSHTYTLPTLKNNSLLNFPASRFFRPWNSFLPFLEFLKVRRIKTGMTKAAMKNEVFHLWWHPHNFGVNQTQNLSQLENILDHYLYLKSKYGYESVTMEGLANKIKL